MLTLNTRSGRHLQEGDVVRLLSGPRSGAIGKVVGFDYVTDSVVVQYPRPRVGGIIRESVPINELELQSSLPRKLELEPLPPTAAALREKLVDTPLGCGAMVSFPLKEGGLITFVPKGNLPLGPVVCRHSVSERRMEVLFEHGFVTRLPHEVRVGLARLDTALQENMDPAEVVDRLLVEQ